MVKDIKIGQLKAAEYNPRIDFEPGTPEWEKLRRSIEQFGNVEPIVWNKRTGNVVGGHQRLAVLKSMGYKAVPCSIVDLDAEDEKLLNVALNKIRGQWDYDKLEEILSEFDYGEATASGFSEEEIAILLANNDDLIESSEDIDWDEIGEDGEDDEDGFSYVVTLVFEDAWLAEQWADRNGFSGKVKDGASTTVIRIDG